MPSKQKDDPNGYSPIQCFVLIDSHGERNGPYPCTDTETLEIALNGKKGVNLQIAMWIEGVIEGTIFVEEVREWTREYPDWVFKGFINQLRKKHIEKLGWIPMFVERYLS